MQIKPAHTDIIAGITYPTILNSKYIKSTMIGTKHITPIPIISMPEFLAIMNKSVLLIYLINVPSKFNTSLILNKYIYKFLSKIILSWIKNLSFF